MKKQTVALDFDGVIHSYTSGWQGADVIPDPPVDGIKEMIDILREDYTLVVVSSRCAYYSGKKAIEDYLHKHDITVDAIFSEKVPAIVYIDDRAICFDGDTKSMIDKVKNFKPWNT